MDNEQLFRLNQARDENGDIIFHHYFLIDDENLYGKVFIYSDEIMSCVQYYKNGLLNCDCQDSYATKYICKHRCYIYDYLLDLSNKNFYKTSRITPKHRDYVQKFLFDMKICINPPGEDYEEDSDYDSDESCDCSNCCEKEYQQLVDFKEKIRDINKNDTCPICLIKLIKKSKIYFCQDCKNPVHQKCMDKHLSNKKECVLCRSDLWKFQIKS